MIGKFGYFLRMILAAAFTAQLILPWLALPALSSGSEFLTADAAQCADILGIRQEAEEIVSSYRRGTPDGQLLDLRAHALRKILQGALQVQAAENHLEMEMAYTYHAREAAQRRINTVNQFFNIANFLQFGILYTIEPYSREHKQFVQSAICTTVGGGIGIVLPVLNILYNNTAKASNIAPPAYLAHLVDGKPVDGSRLPPYVAQYIDSRAAGSSISRREALNAVWIQRHHADMRKKETLCGIDDGKSKKLSVLSSRIVLLWSLYTAVQGFDHELLALLNQLSDSSFDGHLSPSVMTLDTAKLGGKADQAARLLHLESIVAELRSLNVADTNNVRKTSLQLTLMERILAGYLDMRIGADKCQEALNYQYDIVLAQMMARRRKFLQKTYEANFIQTNTLGATAGLNYLEGHTKAGNELFLVANSIGICITTISLLATQGGWRKNEAAPNSLADFFDLRANEQHGFSPLIWNFLNSPSERSGGKPRREYLQEVWKGNAVVDMDLKQKRNQEKLGSMPSCKWDTIKLVVNRIALLSALREELGQFDVELLDLLRKAWPETMVSASANNETVANAPAALAAKLLGVQSLVAEISNHQANRHTKILLTRQVLEGFLEASADGDLLGQEIVTETQVMNRMIRQRDMAIQLTNILNFYQIGILGVISNSLSLSDNSKNIFAGNQINIVSGFMVSCLALTALLESHGGLRPNKAEPNLLGNVFGKKSSYINLSPLMVNYLNSIEITSPTGLTRRQELIKYWQESKVLNVNVKHTSTHEKLSAEGRAHNWWDESINLINNRISMLYDVRAILRNSNLSFDSLLTTVD